ncbi:hypothetical protein GOP47_0019480 [Adiantum capillus-veneris]|uniref:Uncharacterized protein n=1 Tax=Adiantum capillus-veneris TaxID=13818 RepID=A0A9D4UBL5_ADICA|nr:hypothetical protein GOP47_0019480 [Adiantum capillus-veneris]
MHYKEHSSPLGERKSTSRTSNKGATKKKNKYVDVDIEQEVEIIEPDSQVKDGENEDPKVTKDAVSKKEEDSEDVIPMCLNKPQGS